MPNYDYECNSCKYYFTTFHSMKMDALKTCPKCNLDELQRIVIAPYCRFPDRILLEDKAGEYQFKDNPEVGDYYRSIARAAGVNTDGKAYLGSIAAFPGDPEAWVEGVADVKRVLDERNWSSDGLVKREAIRTGESETVDIADDIVASAMFNASVENPALLTEKVGDVAAMVKDKLKPSNNNDETINKLEKQFIEYAKACDSTE